MYILLFILTFFVIIFIFALKQSLEEIKSKLEEIQSKIKNLAEDLDSLKKMPYVDDGYQEFFNKYIELKQDGKDASKYEKILEKYSEYKIRNPDGNFGDFIFQCELSNFFIELKEKSSK